MFPPRGPLPTFNWVFEYQSIASEILTQPSRYRKQFASRRKMSLSLEPGTCLVYASILGYIYFLSTSFSHIYVTPPMRFRINYRGKLLKTNSRTEQTQYIDFKNMIYFFNLILNVGGFGSSAVHGELSPKAHELISDYYLQAFISRLKRNEVTA